MKKEEFKIPENIVNTKIKKPRKKKKETSTFTSKGCYSDDIRATFNEPTPEQIRRKTLIALNRNREAGDILWGQVAGVLPYKSKANSFYVAVRYNDVMIYIPENCYFAKNFKFGIRYLSLNEEEKFKWRKFIVRESLDAWVCFTLKAVVEQPMGEAFDNGIEIVGFGDRTEALGILQDICFFHRNRKETTKGEPITIVPGQKVEAHVLSVKEDLVCVEACGVETKLDALTISDDYIDNCKDEYYPGQKIDLYVKSVETVDGEVTLRLTGRNREINQKTGLIHPGDIFFGHVTKYSKLSENYTVSLSIGVKAIVAQSNVEGRIPLAYGDKVAVFVTEVFPDRVIGNAIKR